MPAKKEPEGGRRFVRVRFKGDEKHPQRNLVFGVVAEDWQYAFVKDRDVRPGDEGDLLVEGEPPFPCHNDYVLVRVGEGPAFLAEEGEERTVDYWAPMDDYFLEVIE